MFADKKEFIEKQAREQVRYIAVFLLKVFLPGDWKGGILYIFSCSNVDYIKTRCFNVQVFNVQMYNYTQESFINTTEDSSSLS